MLTLFSGACGGWDLGMERAGYEVVAACEADPWRRAVLQRNFPAARIYEDVRGLGAARLVDDLGALPDVIVGSPPCQDASSANAKGRGVDGERTGLFFEAIRIVAECRPLWCCLENVPGLRARGVDRVLAGLEAAGYACWPLVVGAVHAGAPHRRNRVWIVGARHDVADATEARRLHAEDTRADRCGKGAGLCEVRADAGLCEPQRAHRGARADAYGQGQHAVAQHDEVGGLTGDGRPAAYADDRRAFAQAWPDWNDGFAGFGRVDDGLPRGVARAALAAYGDAVVPQITEAIGRAMRRLTRPMPAEAGL